MGNSVSATLRNNRAGAASAKTNLFNVSTFSAEKKPRRAAPQGHSPRARISVEEAGDIGPVSSASTIRGLHRSPILANAAPRGVAWVDAWAADWREPERGMDPW